MPDVKNIFAVYQNTNEVYLAQFLACLVEKRRNEKEKSLGGGKHDLSPPCDAALCRGSLRGEILESSRDLKISQIWVSNSVRGV